MQSVFCIITTFDFSKQPTHFSQKQKKCVISRLLGVMMILPLKMLTGCKSGNAREDLGNFLVPS